YRLDYPELNDAEWFVHCNLKKGADGGIELFTRPVEPYVVPLEEKELGTYRNLRIAEPAKAAEPRAEAVTAGRIWDVGNESGCGNRGDDHARGRRRPPPQKGRALGQRGEDRRHLEARRRSGRRAARANAARLRRA